MTREHLGLPANWNVVEKWARGKFNFGVLLTDNSVNDKSKFSGLKFSKPADSTFWDNFPSRQLPSRPSTRVDTPQLRRAIHAFKKDWTIHKISQRTEPWKTSHWVPSPTRNSPYLAAR